MTVSSGRDILKAKKTLAVGENNYEYYSIKAAEKTLGDVSRLPYCLKVFLENMLRFGDGEAVTENDIRGLAARIHPIKTQTEVSFRPSRVLMQDMNGVPALIDLASMRDAVKISGFDPDLVNPVCPVDLVVDRSVSADDTGKTHSLAKNMDAEFSRNRERFSFLRWAQSSFKNLRVIPPGAGVCHQVNLEYLSSVVRVEQKDKGGTSLAFPDSLVGTDVHSSMANSLGILAWAVSGVEAESVLLDNSLAVIVPEVVGVRLSGSLKKGVTATDLALTLTQKLKEHGVADKLVEFFGAGLDGLNITDRATIANMAPEYGAICAIFPIDAETVKYMKLTDKPQEHIDLVEAYAKEQGLWRGEGDYDEKNEPTFASIVRFDLGSVEPSVAGPFAPYERMPLSSVPASFKDNFPHSSKTAKNKAVDGPNHGDVLIAAITSCANTSNYASMLVAGLVARKARAKGLRPKPWVKTSFSAGSRVVADCLTKTGLQADLDAMGFNIVAYGCGACAGNAGLFGERTALSVPEGAAFCAVISGNENCGEMFNPRCEATYLASPGLVVAYSILGTACEDVSSAMLGTDSEGKPVYLRDIWPTIAELEEAQSAAVSEDMFRHRYASLFAGSEEWKRLELEECDSFKWNENSIFVRNPPLFDNFTFVPKKLSDIYGARILAILGDDVSANDISPSGKIEKTSAAGEYLSKTGAADFGTYGIYRGNHDVMARGMFDSPRIENKIVAGTKGAVTKHFPSGEAIGIYEAAQRYREEKVPLVVVAGSSCGRGFTHDWSAKGLRFLGVRAVVAENFDRAYRSNLVAMGILPLELKSSITISDLDLNGEETLGIAGLSEDVKPLMEVMLTINRESGVDRYMVICRIDTAKEAEYYKHDGLLMYMLREIFQKTA